MVKKHFLHQEYHKANFTLPEIILGGQDGLVNVLGVILGVAAATSSSTIILAAGLAATFAESISMAAVAYTSTKAEAEIYQAEYERKQRKIDYQPEVEKEELRLLYSNYGFNGTVLNEIVERITGNKDTWLKVMMEQELKLEPVDPIQALSAAFIVGFSALVGSFVPLTPFIFLPVRSAVFLSLIVSSITLFVVGYFKAQKTLGRNLLRQGIELMVIGMVSAFAGYFIGSLFSR